jgi:hypothetical protein
LPATNQYRKNTIGKKRAKLNELKSINYGNIWRDFSTSMTVDKDAEWWVVSSEW